MFSYCKLHQLVMDEGDDGDNPGGGLQPQNPEALNIFKDNSYMVIMKGKK